jgi:hypothetical protein
MGLKMKALRKRFGYFTISASKPSVFNPFLILEKELFPHFFYNHIMYFIECKKSALLSQYYLSKTALVHGSQAVLRGRVLYW